MTRSGPASLAAHLGPCHIALSTHGLPATSIARPPTTSSRASRGPLRLCRLASLKISVGEQHQ